MRSHKRKHQVKEQEEQKEEEEEEVKRRRHSSYQSIKWYGGCANLILTLDKWSTTTNAILLVVAQVIIPAC